MLRQSFLVPITAISFLPPPRFAEAAATPTMQSDSRMEKKNMQKARTNLSGLIEERLVLVSEVAKSKWNSGSPIEDSVREHEVLAEVGRQAEQAGLPSAWVQHFFRLQIEAAKVVEYQLISEWKKSGRKAFDDAPDLASQSRPQLDGLSTALIAALKDDWPTLKTGSFNASNVTESSTCKRYPRACALATTPLEDGSVESSLLAK
jgi:chorismate mutase